MYICRFPKNMEPEEQIGQLQLIYHLELRRKGWVLV